MPALPRPALRKQASAPSHPAAAPAHLLEQLLHAVHQRAWTQVHSVELVVLSCSEEWQEVAAARVSGKASRKGEASLCLLVPQEGSWRALLVRHITHNQLPTAGGASQPLSNALPCAPKAMTGTSSAPASSATLTNPRRRFSTKSRQPR